MYTQSRKPGVGAARSSRVCGCNFGLRRPLRCLLLVIVVVVVVVVVVIVVVVIGAMIIDKFSPVSVGLLDLGSSVHQLPASSWYIYSSRGGSC